MQSLARKLSAVALVITFLMVGCREENLWSSKAHVWETVPLIVIDDGEFTSPLRTAISLWNDRVGCELFKMGDEYNVQVLSATGTPCGHSDAPVLGKDVAGAAYLCGRDSAEVHIFQPGDTWQQAFIIHHELGHVLGLADDDWGAMGGVPREATMIRASDKDTAAVRGRYCD